MLVFDFFSAGYGLIDDFFFTDDTTPTSFIIGIPFLSVATDLYTPQQVTLPLEFNTQITGSVTVQIKEALATGIPLTTIIASGSVTFDTSDPTTYSGGSILINVSGSGIITPGNYYTICATYTIDKITGLTDYCRLKGIAWIHTYFGSLLTSVDGVNWTVFTNPLHVVAKGYRLPYFVWGEVYVPRDPDRPDANTVTFPATRPDAYAPDDVWKPGEWSGGVFTPGDWATPGTDRYFATGGGRWNQQLVVCGNGQVYYEAL